MGVAKATFATFNVAKVAFATSVEPGVGGQVRETGEHVAKATFGTSDVAKVAFATPCTWPTVLTTHET
ncbi:hypothetical protein H4W30_006343 [Amycolatopsis roodepoortensis]|uniref:Uncharacterized protein n=1 Tax=Amycolatopsis roodepoortensis TaxID=700274 RepID=A0ABR9LGI9_9PSEU|nr:hypothetical protein [Amycolatopsis roodepoortensis]